jgi:tetratricopeptide (TPR) repeat protein
LGHALIQLNRLDAARQQYSSVLSEEPTNVKAMIGLALADFHEGNWAAALAQAQAAQVNSGENFTVLFTLGRAAKLAGDAPLATRMLEKADKVIEKYLEMNPGKPEGHYLRGEVAYVQDNFASALEYYRAAEDVAKPGRMYLAYGENFSLADVLAKQGVCLQRLDKPDKARELGKRVLDLDPNHKLGQALCDA